MTHLNNIIRFNQKENEKNTHIYQLLKKQLIESLNFYDLGDNLIAVYFVHLVKYLTGTYIRNNELKHNLVLDEFRNETIDKIPFISYSDIITKIINKKKPGVNTNSKFQFRSRTNNFINFLINNKIYADVASNISNENKKSKGWIIKYWF